MKRRRTIEGVKVHRRVRILVLIMNGDEDFIVNKNKQNCDAAKIDRKNDRLIHKHICALTITQTYTDRYFSKLTSMMHLYQYLPSVRAPLSP